MINTLINRAKKISDEEHLTKELDHLKKAFKWNGNDERQFDKAIRKTRRQLARQRIDEGEVVNRTKFLLPYIKGTIDKLTKILKKKNITVTFSPQNSIKKMMDHVKDPIKYGDCKGVYYVPCSSKRTYIGEIG